MTDFLSAIEAGTNAGLRSRQLTDEERAQLARQQALQQAEVQFPQHPPIIKPSLAPIQTQQLSLQQAIENQRQAMMDDLKANQDQQKMGIDQQASDAKAQEEAVKLMGMQGYDADIAAGLSPEEALRKNASKLYFKNPSGMASTFKATGEKQIPDKLFHEPGDGIYSIDQSTGEVKTLMKFDKTGKVKDSVLNAAINGKIKESTDTDLSVDQQNQAKLDLAALRKERDKQLSSVPGFGPVTSSAALPDSPPSFDSSKGAGNSTFWPDPPHPKFEDSSVIQKSTPAGPGGIISSSSPSYALPQNPPLSVTTNANGEITASSSLENTPLAPIASLVKPPKSAINYLIAHPELADQFDAQFGKGTSDQYLP